MGLHKFKTSSSWPALTQCAQHSIHQCEGAHKFTPTVPMCSINAHLSMDVSVNFRSLSSGSLQCKDAAARAKGVPQKCVTYGQASSHAPDWCGKCGTAKHRVARDSAVKVHARCTLQGANTSFKSQMKLLQFDNLATPRSGSSSHTIPRTFRSAHTFEKAKKA